MTSPALPDLPALTARLMALPGIVAVVLGGSRARGTATPESDLDLGLYYRADPGFDLERLRQLCRELDDGGEAQPTAPGGWGPWVDGGAWLTVGGVRVDFIYRELGRVERSVRDALAGHVELHAQPGHPHGIHSHHYAAELALCQVLADPEGQVAALKARLSGYPDALKAALERHYGWQPGFWLDAAAKGLQRGDLHYAQGCTYQAVMAAVQVLCARGGVWLTNEKGALALAAGVPGAPPRFAERGGAALEKSDPEQLRHLLAEVG
ncbi:nucleotidyltransferase [Deinococcus irradiatisoli]|uniref:Nucleotidyltransferase n=1 Tax=Deinococcus irradiatisoli TaxID=2202254 RepID=A0A2Z3JBW7_9DEIO|nr:nucleotidyltransferase domain-containing protein [Deinococcus irradiatisoli]AWN22643.1 nucleotidyltransferase [Deinococcus irradiatisoli]